MNSFLGPLTSFCSFDLQQLEIASRSFLDLKPSRRGLQFRLVVQLASPPASSTLRQLAGKRQQEIVSNWSSMKWPEVPPQLMALLLRTLCSEESWWLALTKSLLVDSPVGSKSSQGSKARPRQLRLPGTSSPRSPSSKAESKTGTSRAGKSLATIQ